jgi:hypothetical protein
MIDKKNEVPLVDSTIESREAEESLERTKAELGFAEEEDEKKREAHIAKLREIFKKI